MKHHRIFIYLFVYVLFLPSSLAQDVTQWRVSKGDEASFGPTAVNAIVFSPDGAQLAVAGVNGITVYDTHTGEVLALLRSSLRHVTALAFSPDNHLVASADEDSTIHLWNAHTGENITDFTSHTDPIVTLAFSADGDLLASGSFKEIRLWNLTSGQMRRATVLRGHRDMVTTLAFSPDSKTLASASFYGTILLWDLEISQLRYSLSAHVDSIQALAFSPDGQTLASGGYWNSEARSTIRVWHIHTGNLLATFENHTTPVFTLAFAVDGITLASAGWDNTIRLWDPYTGQLQAILGDNTAPVLALAFLPDTDGSDGKTLASASLDGTIQLKPLIASSARIPNQQRHARAANVIQEMDFVYSQDKPRGDVNNDGVVNILDLTFIASRFGEDSPDLNGDGVVNILDLTLVAQHIAQ